MTKLELARITAIKFAAWPRTKDTVTYFGFREYIKSEYGYVYYGYDSASFDYDIIDEKKFAWFLLSHKPISV